MHGYCHLMFQKKTMPIKIIIITQKHGSVICIKKLNLTYCIVKCLYSQVDEIYATGLEIKLRDNF